MILPPLRAGDYLLWLALVPQVIVVVLAIRLYRRERTKPFAFLMCGCVSLVLARSSWFTFGFIAGFFLHDPSRSQRSTVWHWTDYADVTFQLLSFICMLVALFSFLRQHPVDTT